MPQRLHPLSDCDRLRKAETPPQIFSFLNSIFKINQVSGCSISGSTDERQAAKILKLHALDHELQPDDPAI